MQQYEVVGTVNGVPIKRYPAGVSGIGTKPCPRCDEMMPPSAFNKKYAVKTTWCVLCVKQWFQSCAGSEAIGHHDDVDYLRDCKYPSSLISDMHQYNESKTEPVETHGRDFV